jgi:Mitochondrial ribosomal subunit protein
VVEFSPSADTLSLSAEQRAKLIKLAGNRYNPSTDIIRMSCESFFEPAQNKRYLGELVDVLLKEARDLSTDDFADVPFDFRHHRPKRFHKFPTEWIRPDEKKAEIAEPQTQQIQGSVVDGMLCIPGGAEARDREVSSQEQAIKDDQLWNEKRGDLEAVERDMLRAKIEARLESTRVAASTEERSRGKHQKKDSYRLPRQIKLARGVDLMKDARSS